MAHRAAHLVTLAGLDNDVTPVTCDSSYEADECKAKAVPTTQPAADIGIPVARTMIAFMPVLRIGANPSPKTLPPAIIMFTCKEKKTYADHS